MAKPAFLLLLVLLAPVTSRAADPIAEFEAKQIRIERRIFLPMTRDARAFGDWLVPVEGVKGRPLGAAFYERVGRPDLAAAYRVRLHRQNRRVAFATVVALGGVAIGDGILLVNPHWNDDQKLGAFAGGTALALAGSGLLLRAAHDPVHPVSPEEIASLAEAYNAQLREELGLPPPTASLRVTPFAAVNGAGVAITARF